MNLDARELPPPPAVVLDLRTGEIARVWEGDNGVHVALNQPVSHDPILWGSILVTIANHIARSYELSGRGSASDALRRIKEGLEATWPSMSPASPPLGGLLGMLWRR
jgi:hypothetical protein